MNRDVPLRRTSFLQPGQPLRSVPLRSTGRITASRAGKIPAAGRLVSRQPINPVSDRRRAENRERKAMADRRWPDRREGTVMCYIPGCPLPASDLNEILPRGRGGSITDEENCVPLCRPHHDVITFTPDSELEWAYSLGIKKHSWDARKESA